MLAKSISSKSSVFSAGDNTRLNSRNFASPPLKIVSTVPLSNNKVASPVIPNPRSLRFRFVRFVQCTTSSAGTRSAPTTKTYGLSSKLNPRPASAVASKIRPFSNSSSWPFSPGFLAFSEMFNRGSFWNFFRIISEFVESKISNSFTYSFVPGFFSNASFNSA